MAIRRISELDKVELSNYLTEEDVLKPDANLGNLVFEASEFAGETNEAPSYYLSKKLTLADLSALVIAGIRQEINSIAVDVNAISAGLSAWNVIKDWTINGMPGTTGYYPANISCTNLSVQNPIIGCATSAMWN